MPANQHCPKLRNNRLLLNLSREECLALCPSLKLIPLQAGTEIDSAVLTFPLTSVIAISKLTTEGINIPLTLIGNEGVIGVNHCLSKRPTRYMATSLLCGWAIQLSDIDLIEKSNELAQFRESILDYSQALMESTSQFSFCGRHHPAIQRLSGILLYILHVTKSNRINITHELLAHVLGVRRENITHACTQLRETGAICSQRGVILIVDPQLLESFCCACFSEKKELDNSIGPAPVPALIKACKWASNIPLVAFQDADRTQHGKYRGGFKLQ